MAADDSWVVTLANNQKIRVDGATFNAIQAVAAGDASDTGWLIEATVLNGGKSIAGVLINAQQVLMIHAYVEPEGPSWGSISTQR